MSIPRTGGDYVPPIYGDCITTEQDRADALACLARHDALDCADALGLNNDKENNQ